MNVLRFAGMLACVCAAGTALAQTPPQAVPEVPYTITSVPFGKLTDQHITPDGQRALAIRPAEWHHCETPHFVLHYFRSFIAAPVSVEAEYFHRYITADLGLTPQAIAEAGGGKTHLYLFESREDWVVFRKAAALEAWTGAVCIDGALFVPRYPEFKWKGNALGHEIAHLLVNRYVGRKSPLWLKEGQAEEVSSRGYAAYFRARGYLARPQALIPNGYIPLARLTSLTAYPPDTEVETLYRESRALVAYMSAEGRKERFLKMFRSMAQGAPFPAAFSEAYGSQWSSLDALESAFKQHMEATAGQ
ncbi:MAG: hypothetical protein PHQ12_13500 [Chthoniobacteraceae bacterium]|nr:hypothetical protein [Chthoniobacteraceae bacterium]